MDRSERRGDVKSGFAANMLQKQIPSGKVILDRMAFPEKKRKKLCKKKLRLQKSHAQSDTPDMGPETVDSSRCEKSSPKKKRSAWYTPKRKVVWE